MIDHPLFLVSDANGGNPYVVRARTVEDAVALAASRRSVAALANGVTLVVWMLGNFPEQFHVAYDGPPMNDDHTPTDARLVTRPLGRPSIAGTTRAAR